MHHHSLDIRSLLAGLTLMVLSCGLFSQQPAYFILGEEHFKGLQVYDVVQDGLGNYLFSTNEGLFYYDYLRFEPLGCDQAKSVSMFNLVADPSGTIYCSNLNHQIFRIRDRECSLIYTLSPEEDSPDLSLIIAGDGHLLACSQKVIRLSPNGEVLERSVSASKPWARPIQTPTGDVLLHCPNTDTILRYNDGRFQIQRIPSPEARRGGNFMLNFFVVDARLYAVDLFQGAVYSIRDSSLEMRLLPGQNMIDNSQPLRLYATGATTWVAGSLPGVVWLHGQPETVAPRRLYERYFISDVFEDREGNLLLSTFDKGVIVIPDVSIPGVIDAFAEEPVTALHVDTCSGTLNLGTTRGNLLRLHEGALQRIIQDGTRPIEGIFGTDERMVFQGGDQIMVMGNSSGMQPLGLTAALKDVIFIHPDLAFLATSRGIYRCDWKDRKNAPKVNPLPGFEFRIHHMAYDKPGNALVASTSRGLYHIRLDGTSSRILLGNEDIFPTALCTDGSKTFAATRQHGILVMERGRIVSRIQPEIGQLETIGKLVVRDDRIFAKSSHGLYQMDADGHMQRNIGKAFGFNRSRIYDFVLDGGHLWVSHSGGVQAVDLSSFVSGRMPPRLRLNHVAVNDRPVPTSAPGTFASDERKLRFDIAFPSLRNRESLRIHYQLEGYDTTWMVMTEEERSITYNALGPGDYSFHAKAEIQGAFSEPVSYSFKIVAPIYRRWWFTGAILLAMVGGIGAFSGRQLRLQRRKARQLNELNASKLVAIQSQMNPHFIFNAMNSIQDLILNGDIENSYSYVSTFADLVRSTLKYSERDFIDFEQELELLRLYLSLEKLRFEDDLRFEINDEVDEDIQIPPLLIQPFVENALLHGLLHKPGEKVLKIGFSLQESLVCTIEDNGIGRVRAKAIRDRQRSEHESFSGSAIRKRFDILSEVFKGGFGYHYEDLMTDGEPSGTRITLRIPIRRRF